MQAHRILLTTSFYQDVPGPRDELLRSTSAKVVRELGQLSEKRMFELVGDFLCGDAASDKLPSPSTEKFLSPGWLRGRYPRVKLPSLVLSQLSIFLSY